MASFFQVNTVKVILLLAAWMASMAAFADVPGQMEWEQALAVRDNSKEYRQWVQAAAEHSHPQALVAMGQISVRDRAYEQAYDLFARAAFHGEPMGWLNMAFLLEKKQVAVANPRERVALLQKVIEAMPDSPGAQIGLMQADAEGLVVLPPEIKAEYASHTTEKGLARGMCFLADYLRTGTGFEKDVALARSWYTEAARQDAACGYAGLAIIKEYGLGVDSQPSIKAAYLMYLIAALWDQGYQSEVERLKARLSEQDMLQIQQYVLTMQQKRQRQEGSSSSQQGLTP